MLKFYCLDYYLVEFTQTAAKPNIIYPHIAIIENEAHSIWHITELLSKLGSSSGAISSADQPDLCDDSEVTLTTETIRHVARQIANHVSNIVEHVEGLDIK